MALMPTREQPGGPTVRRRNHRSIGGKRLRGGGFV